MDATPAPRFYTCQGATNTNKNGKVECGTFSERNERVGGSGNACKDVEELSSHRRRKGGNHRKVVK